MYMSLALHHTAVRLTSAGLCENCANPNAWTSIILASCTDVHARCLNVGTPVAHSARSPSTHSAASNLKLK